LPIFLQSKKVWNGLQVEKAKKKQRDVLKKHYSTTEKEGLSNHSFFESCAQTLYRAKTPSKTKNNFLAISPD
jgi:hypothetical protein